MKAFIVAVVAVIVVAFVGAWVLSTQQRTAATAFSTESVRIGDPGRNLLVEPASRRADNERGERTSRE